MTDLRYVGVLLTHQEIYYDSSGIYVSIDWIRKQSQLLGHVIKTGEKKTSVIKIGRKRV